MSDEVPDERTKSAFSSPTSLTAKRLGHHQYNGPRTLSPSGSDVSARSNRSRRSQSMIHTSHDAEIFDQITSATGVRVASKRKNRGASTPPVTANMGQGNFFDGVMRSISPYSFTGSDMGASLPPNSPANSMDGNEFFLSEEGRSKAHTQTNSSNLDLKNNDNSFHVMANLLVDFFQARVRGNVLRISLDDVDTIERLLPASARRLFIDSLQYRLNNTPVEPMNPLDSITLQCQQLGLHRDGPKNPIVAASMLDEDETEIQLPLEGQGSQDDDEDINAHYKDMMVELGHVSPIEKVLPKDANENPLSETTAIETGRVGTAMQTAVEANETRSGTSAIETGRVSNITMQTAPPSSVAVPDETMQVEPEIVVSMQGENSVGRSHSKEQKVEDDIAKQPSYEFPDPSSTDNIAQKTILMELQEAVHLMKTSTTPETVQFWKNHVDDLKSRLKALTGSASSYNAPLVASNSMPIPQPLFPEPEQPNTPYTEEVPAIPSISTMAPSIVSTFKNNTDDPSVAAGNIKPPPAIQHPTPASDAHTVKAAPQTIDQTAHLEATRNQQEKPQGSSQVQDASQSIPPRQEEAATKPSQTLQTKPKFFPQETPQNVLPARPQQDPEQKKLEQQPRAQPDPTPTMAVTAQSPCATVAEPTPATQATPAENFQSPPMTPASAFSGQTTRSLLGTSTDVPESQSYVPPTSSGMSHNTETKTNPAPMPNYELPMVDVVSPADLPGGYNFEAEIEGQRFLATVPAGGVQEGETFTCYMRELESVAFDIPVGYWKDSILNICRHGCCHPVLWSSIFCPLLTLGQTQQRTNLDFLGRPQVFYPSPNRKMMFTVISFWVVINIMLFLGFNIKWSTGMELSIADWAAFALLNGTYLGFIVFVTQSTRNSLREKFLIREERCYDLEDLCCSTLCLPCTVSQMSRHTANFDEYEAVCCSKTGLPDGVMVNQASVGQSGSYMV